MSYIKTLHLKQTCHRVDGWNLKSFAPNKQILWMSKPLDLLSILATHQWNTKINLNFFFLGFHVIVEIYQIGIDNWIKSFNPNEINKLCFGVSHQNNRSLNFEIILLDFIEIIGNFLYNFFFNGLYYLDLKIFFYNKFFINLPHYLDFKFFFYSNAFINFLKNLYIFFFDFYLIFKNNIYFNR